MLQALAVTITVANRIIEFYDDYFTSYTLDIILLVDINIYIFLCKGLSILKSIPCGGERIALKRWCLILVQDPGS